MIVQTDCGTVEGTAGDGYAAFLGIPYAAAPYPEHAFDPPRPPTPWTGVFDATSPGASPAHPHVDQELFPDPVVAGDNPLNLNVYTPAGHMDSGATHPVVLWLYGGGFFTGSNASPWYTGESFARNGIVLVVPNYRVAAEGFMILDDQLANRALQDVIQALRWVRDNITAFGGDPTRVTVAGQSAGATAALALTGCPDARGLFHRLAAMSAGTPLLAARSRMQRLSEEFAAELRTERTRTALTHIPVSQRLALEATWLPEEVQAPPHSVEERARRAGRGALRWQPTHDGDIVTVAPSEALAVPGALDALLIGTTVEEWNFILGDTAPAPSKQACVEGFANLGRTVEDLDQYLQALGTDNAGQALAQALTDHTFRSPAHRIAQTAATAGIPTYAYQFAWPAPVFGAAHCTDLPFVFDHLDAPGATELLGPNPPAHLATVVHTALVRFAHGENPGWTAYDTTERHVMVFDDHSHEVPDALRRTPQDLRRR
ncbi:carboxylesterase family protein [Actinacidiphila alni]|uniref:carboxylesterase/lipase family protein n=1 Tax=Actinacidiphila alni TaxID=380248 RepID=UPI0033F64E38